MTHVIEGLEVGADRPFQERLWFWERVGWAAMLLLVVAALAGLTGTTGPASWGKVEAGGAGEPRSSIRALRAGRRRIR